MDNLDSESTNETGTAPEETTQVEKTVDPEVAGLKRRIDKLTARSYADQEAQAKILEQLAHYKSMSEQSVVEKTREDFASDAEYTTHVTNTAMEKVFAERDQVDKQKYQKEVEAEAEAKRWSEKVEAVMAIHPDYSEVISSAEIDLPQNVVDAVKQSEKGAELAYILAKQPDMVEMFSRANPQQLERAILKAELKLEMAPPQVSKAPAPTPTVDGGAGAPKSYTEMTPTEFREARNRELYGNH